MWKILGVSAKIEKIQNSFENPFDASRKVFIFSDAPHLIKTIRNRLHSKKTLKVRFLYTCIIPTGINTYKYYITLNYKFFYF